MAEVMPDRAFEQIRLQPPQRFGCEQVVKINRAGPAAAKAAHQNAKIGPLAHRAPGELRRATDVDRTVVVIAKLLDLPIGQLLQLFSDSLRHLAVSARQSIEALWVTGAFGEVMKLFSVVQKLAARRLRQ